MKKKLSIIILVLLLALVPQTVFAQANDFPFERLGELFFPQTNKTITEKVYLSGEPVGITADGDGVTVIGLNEFVSTNGVVSPSATAGIAVGDVIIEFDGEKISNIAQLAQKADQSGGRSVNVKYKRDGKVYEAEITSSCDALTKKFRIGVFVRDNASGIGTLTYIRKNLQFGCLGHPIVNGEKGEIVPVKTGGLYKCTINSVIKGTKGNAGELKGSFATTDRIGTLYINNRFGVYGNMSKLPDDFKENLFSVATSNQIKPGKAQILTTVEGSTPQRYDIEIMRVIGQTSAADKGLVLRITDQRLIDKTGGIVQGMSGSPIIQNEQFVGAVTHVFVNDPTRGYGILAEWMLEN